MSETNTSQVMGQWEAVKKNFAESILKMFPIQGRKNVLEMQEITFDESKAHPSDIRAQELAKHQEKTWGIPVYAKFVLKDKLTGQTINESKQKLAVMPRLTPRDTYIVSGGEWNSAYQWRLKSGIYSKVKENGQLETEFNLNGAGKDFAREARLKIPFDPEKKSFKLKYGTISIPLYSMLKADDMSDEDIKREWGEDIFNANYKKNWQQDITKLYNSKLKKRGVVAESDTFDHIKIAVQKELHKAEVLPETTKLTLGKEIQNLSGKALLDGSMHILGVSQGKKPDDVYSVYFKHLLGLDDFIAEKFGGSKTAQAIKAKIRNTIDKREKVAQIIPNDLFSKPLSQVFIGNTLSQRPDQTNPIDILSSSSITTIKGPGGISSDHSIRNPMKVISQSHFAILDPILSPECFKEGAELLTWEGYKKVEEITYEDKLACLINGKLEYHEPEKVHVYDYEGEMYGVNGDRAKYLVTPNHRILCRPGWGSIYKVEEADKVAGKYVVVKNTHEAFECDEVKSFKLPMVPLVVPAPPTLIIEDELDINLWAEFMGWWLSEGSAATDGKHKVSITQLEHCNKENVEKIRDLLSNLPWKFYYYKGKDFAITNKQLNAYLQQFGKCNDKHIPEYFFRAPKEARERLLDCLMRGDGRTCLKAGKYEQAVYTTTSAQLALDVERLIISLGHGTTHHVYQDKRQERYLDVHEVRVLRRPELHIYKDMHYKEFHKGKVYCVTVPGSFVYAKYKDGAGLWIGNSAETGVTLHLPTGAKKVGREARTLAYDLLHKKFDHINASQLHGDYTVLPDQIKWKGGNPSAIDKASNEDLATYQLGTPSAKSSLVTALDPKTHEFVEIPFEKARYVLPSPRNLFSEATNLIPFLQNNQGNRTMTGAKQPSQGVPLKYREAPLIQVQSNDPNTSFEEFFGRRFSHQTPVNGTITDIVKDKLGNVDEVHIEDTTGKAHKVQLYNNFPLNDKKSFLHAEPVVKIGDKVSKGQQIADSNFTDKGKLAVGVNLSTAYFPYGSLTFEDGVIVSESGAKKLTSEHLHKTALELDPKNDKVSLSKFISHISTVGKKIKKDKLANLDENGIIKPGSIVKPGDLLVTAISKNTLEGQLGSMTSKLKGAYSAYKDKSLVWDHDYEGHVIKVVPKPGEKGYTVYVKTQEPAKVGDKICYDEETEILTKDGWKLVKDITLEDYVWTLTKDHTVEFHQPYQLHKYPTGDDMYKIAAQEMDLFVTLDHNMYIRQEGKDNFEIITAREILDKPVTYLIGNENPTFNDLKEVLIGPQKVTVVKNYKKPVYCLTVENHIVYVRRNGGRGIVSGQCGRHGDKNIIGAIIPDHQMPYINKENGSKEQLDLITAPSGVNSRINLGQLLEMGASKIAKKTGKPYVVTNFAPGVDYAEKLRQEMKEHNVSDTDKIFDPLLNKELEGAVLTGHKYIIKQKHQVEKKESVRGLDQALAGKYSVNFDPQRGKGEGAQAISPLDFYALLAHGARANLKEMSSYKAELQHDSSTGMLTDSDFWNRVMLGIPLQPPKPTFAYRKFEGYLTGLGLNLKKDGHSTVLTPLTDKGVLALSNGEIKEADQTRGKDDKEIPLGLFSLPETGGLPNSPGKGRKWCFNRETLILTNKGLLRIGDIVNKKLQVEVLSYNEVIKKLEYKPILNYWKNVVTEDLIGLHYKTEGNLSGFRRKYDPSVLWTTKAHEVYTSDGKVFANNTENKQSLIASHKLSYLQEQFVYGSLMGDSYLRKGSSFGANHGKKQEEYVKLKISILKELVDHELQYVKSEAHGDFKETEGVRFYTISHKIFSEVHDNCYKDNKKFVSRKWLDKLDAVALAFWYFDDGYITWTSKKNRIGFNLSTQSLSWAEIQTVIEWFKEKWNFTASPFQKDKKYKGKDMGWCLKFGKDDALRFFTMIAPYTPSYFEYKVYREPLKTQCRLCPVSVNPHSEICDMCVLNDIKGATSAWYYDQRKERTSSGRAIRNRYGSFERANAMINGEIPIDFIAAPKDPYLEIKSLFGTKLNELTSSKIEMCLRTTTISEIDRRGVVTPSKTRTVYNIEVEDNHNYIANGILVGNSHMTLAEPFPNPLYCGSVHLPGPAPVLSGLSFANFDKVVKGQMTIPVNGKEMTGGKAIAELLKKIDVKKDFEKIKAQLPTLKGSELNKANKKAKFLQALDRLNLRPEEAYIMNHVPILPPMFRPITVLPDGSNNSADINALYKNLILLNNGLKEKDMLKNFPEKEQKLREDVYDALKATTGLGKVPSYDGNKALKGILQTVAGDSPKTGFFQSKIMKRRQELSMRSTIIPDPNMSIDEVALPKAGAYELYKPFIIRELIRSGKDVLEANKEVKEGTAIAWKALDNAIKDRPVLVKRDPVLHKYNVMAYRPKLIEGNAIGLHPLNCGLGNADFDGNCYIGSTKIHVEISNKNWNNTSVDNLEHFLQEKYQMKFNETTQLVAQNRNGALITLQIKDLPRLEEGKILDRNGAWIYPVPEGISVWSYDHKTNRPIFSPVTGITVEDNCPTVNVETRRFSVTASSNESLCVYDHKTEEVVDICPKDAIGRLCPVMAQIPSFGEYGNTEVGWLIGAFVSDGSIAGNTVHYTKASKEHRDRFYSALGYLQASPIVRHTYEELHGEENAIQGQSIKDHFSRLEKPVVDLFMSCYSPEKVEGRSCLRKKLPSQLEDFSREMLLGILSGLFDGDGSLSISHSKRKAQPIANFATSSIYLVDSIKRLCKLLSIRISVSKTEPKEGRLQKHTSYTISFSIIDLYNYVNELSVIGERKREVLALLASEKRDDGTDIVPVPTFVMQLITTKSGPMNGHSSFAAFNTIKNSRKAGFYVSRDIAEMIISVLVNANVPNLERWINLVRAKNVHWDAVRSVTENKKETVYDLVVPETKVFAVNGGLVVWDTMAVHLPLTEQARQEAIDKMLPSKNLFSATNYGIMHAPDQESIIGLNNLSLWGAKKERNYKSLDDLVKSESHLNDVVNVKIDGQVKETTKGRALLVQSAPQDMDHDKLLHDPSFLLKKSSIHKMLETFAKKDPKGYPVLVDDWRRKGNDRAHEMGFSFNLSDLKPFKEKRDAILAPYHQKAAQIRKSKDGVEEQDNKIVTLYNEATEHLDKELAKDYAAANNNMYKMVDTKARGSMAQFRQTVIAPMLLVDANNRVIPNPVTNSYSEGLNVAQYWTTLHGARKGTLQRAQSTALPGAMAKEIVNLNIATPIVKHDCGDIHGLDMKLMDKKGNNEIDITDRYLAKDIGEFKKDTLITPEVFSKMQQHNMTTIPVRSPLTCKVPQGICAKCFGLNENGKEHEIGTNIGVIASQALSEPAVQMAMDCSADGNLVSVKLNGRTLTLTFEQLWNIVGGFVSEDGDIETKMPMNLEVWDHNKWVEVRTFQRHKPDSVMVIARTESGRSFVVKGSHPSWARKEVTECPSCKTKDSPSYWSHYTNDLKTIVRCNLCSHQFTISRELYDNQIEKIVAAKDLKGLYVPVSPQIVDEGFFSNIPPYIMGFFLAEGNLKRTKVKNEIVEGKTTKRVTPSVCEWRHLMIVFTQNEGPTRERIKAELIKHGLPFSEPANKTITVSNIPLMKEFYQLGISSSKKQLPIGFLGASTEWKLDFLAGLLDGDGCIEGQDRMALDTTSWHLASQVQELVRSIGGKSYLYKTTNKELTRHQGFRLTIRLPYQLNSVKNFPVWTGILENYESYEKIIDVKEILYDGWTYDFSTESKSYTTCGVTTHNSFHTGGVAHSRGGASTSKLERLGQLLNLPKTLPYSATLSKIDGKVHSISKTSTGGHEILIGREKDVHKHYVPSSLDLKVEVGQEIERGDPISSGPINPHQLLQLKDMGAVRKYLTTEMGDMYKDVGGVRRRNVEVVVRNLTNLTEVVDSGKSDHLAGDILPTSIVEAHNRMAKEKDDKILHRPILRGIKESALLKSEDYLSRMNFQRIQNTLIEGAGKMWRTTPRSLDPLSSWSNSSIDIQKDKNDAKY